MSLISRECAFNRPVAAESSTQSIERDVKYLRPFHKRPCLPAPCDLVGIPSVPLLFATRGPSDVSWLIIAVVVYSVQGLRVWADSNILKEVFKFVPAFTDNDAAAAISRIGTVVRSLATGQHSPPTGIGSRIAHSMRRIYFASVTATRRCFARTQMRHLNVDDIPALTTTSPESSGMFPASFATGKRHHFQSSISLINKVYFSHERIIAQIGRQST